MPEPFTPAKADDGDHLTGPRRRGRYLSLRHHKLDDQNDSPGRIPAMKPGARKRSRAHDRCLSTRRMRSNEAPMTSGVKAVNPKTRPGVVAFME